MRIKLFADQSYPFEGLQSNIILYPFFGKPFEDPLDPQSGCFDKYLNVANSLFTMTSLSEADFAVTPADWNLVKEDQLQRELFIQFVQKAKNAGKKTLIFFWNDSNEEIPISNSIIFRTSLTGHYEKKTWEFAMPSWYEDILEKYFNGLLPIRQKNQKPVVSFCGQAAPRKLMFRQKLKDILRQGMSFINLEKRSKSNFKSGNFIRRQALDILARSKTIETNFIIRDKFYGGAVSLPDGGKWDFSLKQKVRSEYIDNMINSDYVVCARGNGNYSHRFYETLSCGRIPVFINTDCVLPYDFEIEWKKYCVWIEEKDLPSISEKLIEFHEMISPQEFVDLQYECRKVWKDFLSPEGFFSNLYRHFKIYES